MSVYAIKRERRPPAKHFLPLFADPDGIKARQFRKRENFRSSSSLKRGDSVNFLRDDRRDFPEWLPCIFPLWALDAQKKPASLVTRFFSAVSCAQNLMPFKLTVSLCWEFPRKHKNHVALFELRFSASFITNNVHKQTLKALQGKRRIAKECRKINSLRGSNFNNAFTDFPRICRKLLSSEKHFSLSCCFPGAFCCYSFLLFHNCSETLGNFPRFTTIAPST